jgi:hypothetical protein
VEEFAVDYFMRSGMSGGYALDVVQLGLGAFEMGGSASCVRHLWTCITELDW